MSRSDVMQASWKTFEWWHRDEVQVFLVYLVVILFFARSSSLESLLLGLTLLVLAGLWLFRWWRRTEKGSELLRGVVNVLPQYPWDRSRLAFSLFSTFIIAILFAHRLSSFNRDLSASIAPESSNATPLDLYWILFLGWYGLIWGAITGFLLYKWRKDALPSDHKFLEGLVGSMYFFHGLPPRSRIVTFVAGFILGGFPTAYAVQIDPADPQGMTVVSFLILPVIALILLGAWFASRWVGTTRSGEV